MGIQGVWLIAKVHLLDGSIPTWRVGLMVSHPTESSRRARGWAIKGLESDIALSTFRDGLNRDSGLILAHGKSVCWLLPWDVWEEVARGDFLIEFQ